MRLEALDIDDLYSDPDQDLNLTRRKLLSIISLLIVSYFCMGTEIRFLKEQQIEGYMKSKEDSLWHGRALEMAVSFLPSDCSLTKHIE